MKKSVLILLLILSSIITIAQNNIRDIVYLKNGSIIKGTIIELVPNKDIKIQTSDGSIFVYEFDQVEKIEKDNVSNIDSSVVIGNSFTGMPFGSYNDDIFAGDSYFSEGSHVFSEEELRTILDDDLFKSYMHGSSLYRNGQFMKNTGWVLFFVGPSLLAISSVVEEKNLANLCVFTGGIAFITGNVLIPIGYVSKGIGKGIISRVAEQCDAVSRNRKTAFNLSPSIINCNLPQQELIALGMSFSINF